MNAFFDLGELEKYTYNLKVYLRKNFSVFIKYYKS